MTQQQINQLWALFERLPLYSELKIQGRSARQLMGYLRTHPDEMDDMLTDGTERNRMFLRWMRKLTNFPSSLHDFQRDATWMLDEFFEDLPSRKPMEYARACGRYRFALSQHLQMEEDEREETGDSSDIEMPETSVPVQLSFVPTTVTERGERTTVLATQLIFSNLSSFLYADLYRGMAAGNIPRRCRNCGRFFLLIGAYDTVYCEGIAPGEKSKTCRKVGAHRTETKKNGTDFVRREYSRVYNRLKARKRNRVISTDEWNRQVARIQELKEQAEAGALSDVELKKEFDAI